VVTTNTQSQIKTQTIAKKRADFYLQQRKKERNMKFDPIKEITDWWAKQSGKGASSQEYQDFVKRMQALMDKPYDQLPDAPDLPTYDKMENDQRTDEELQNQAKNKLVEYEQAMKNKINEQLNQESQTLDKSMQKAKDKHEQANNVIEKNFYQDANKLAGKMANQGLQRSSIASASQDALQAQKSSDIQDMNNEYGNVVFDLDTKIQGLEDKRNLALSDFDVVYAAKLTQDINKLKDERDSNNQKALKYNNSLEQRKQTDYAQYLRNKDQYDKQNGKNHDKELYARQQEFFDSAKGILEGMSKAEARTKLMEDPVFRLLPNQMFNSLFALYAE